MATWSLTVGGVEHAVSIVAFSLDIHETLDGVGTIAGEFISEDGSLTVANDDAVVLQLDATVLFSGFVSRWRLTGANGPGGDGNDATRTYLEAYDHRGPLRRRYTDATEITIPTGSTLKQCLQTLIPFAPELTLAAGQVNGPVTTEDIVINPRTRLSDAITRVVRAAGATWRWRVNYSAELDAIDFGQVSAAFAFVEGDGTECGDVEVEDARDENYANHVFVDGGRVQELGRTESFTGDASTMRFPLEYTPFNTRGYVRNGTAGGFPVNETLGPGSPSSEWYIDTATNELVKVNAPAPANGDPVELTFDGYLDILGEADGRGSPPVQDWSVTVPVSGLSTTAEADAVAAQLLAEYSASQKTVRYPTRRHGLVCGATQSVTTAKRHITASPSEWLVFDIRTTFDGASEGDGLLHTVMLSESGVVKGTFQQTYREWAEAGGAAAAPEPPPAVQIQAAPNTGGVVRMAAGGSNKSIQYNDGGLLGGDSDLTWDKTRQQQNIASTSGSWPQLIIEGSDGSKSQLAQWGNNLAVWAMGAEYDDTSGNDIARSNDAVYFTRNGSELDINIYTGLTPGNAITLANYSTNFIIDDEGFIHVKRNAATGAESGATIVLYNNSGGSGAPGCIGMKSKNGTTYYLWFTDAGVLRFGTARPEEDGAPSESSGSPV